MRTLTKAQKKLLASSPYLTQEILTQLEKMNDYETLLQDARRFHGDIACHRMNEVVQRCMNPYYDKKFNEDKYIKDWK